MAKTKSTPRVRVISHGGEQWASVEDIRTALCDDELIREAGNMVVVGKTLGAPKLVIVRQVIAFFFTKATGILEKVREEE